ncbi:MAG TPA: hypothetical protein VF221_00205 [Chloroflexota bacterium]
MNSWSTRHWIGAAVATALFAAALVFHLSHATRALSATLSSQSVVRGTVEGGDPPADFNHPFVDGVMLPLSEAAQRLPFAARVPRGLDQPLAVFVHEHRPKNEEALGLVYQDMVYGRFIVQEEPRINTQRQFESLLTSCASGCQGSRALTTLSDGTRAVVMVASRVPGELSRA